MAVLRKIVLGVLLAAAAGVVLIAAWELSRYHQQTYNRPYSTLNQRSFSPGDRARILQDRLDLLTRRVGDMELLVLILLGASGLYAVVFVASSYFNVIGFARLADRTISDFQDQMGQAMGDLRELQERTEQRLRQMTAAAPISVEEEPACTPTPAGWQTQISEIAARIDTWLDQPLNEHTRLQLMQDETTAACLEVMAGSGDRAALAGLYLGFGRIYTFSDSARSRFYLERALGMAAPKSPLASEIHYQLACRFGALHDFPHAMTELAAAFENRFKKFDERLAEDIEEGGKLYELASTAPFDKAVNDLLLNMSIGIR
jgi:hypothetical protein